MPTRDRVIHLPITGGQSDDEQDFVLGPDRFAAVTNLEFDKAGALSRRDELARLASTTGRIESLLGYRSGNRDQLAVLTDQGARVYTGDGDGLLEVMATDGPRSMDLRRTPIVRSSEGASVAYSAAGAGYVGHTWTRARNDDDGAVWFAIDDSETGTRVYGPVKVDGVHAGSAATTYTAPVQAANAGLQIVACDVTDAGGTRSVTFGVLCRGTTGTPSVTDAIAAKLYTITNGSTVPGTTTTLQGQAWSVRACGDLSDGRLWTVAYDGTDWDVREYIAGATPVFSTESRITGIGSSDKVHAVHHGPSVDRLMIVAWSSSASEWQYTCPSTAVALVGPYALATLWLPAAPDPLGAVTAGVCETASGFDVALEGAALGAALSGIYLGVKVVRCNSVGAPTSTTGRVVWNAALAAAPFVDDESHTLVPLVAHSWNGGRVSRRQAYLAQVDNTALRRVCEYGQDTALSSPWESGSGTGKTAAKVLPGTFRVRSTGGWAWPVLLEEVDTIELNPSYTDYQALYSAGLVTVTPGAQHVGAVFANKTPVFGAGYLAKVDGERCGEIMQLPPPQVMVQPATAAVGSSLDVRLCWMWRDADGVQHRSAPSETVGIDATAGPQLDPWRVAMPPFVDWSSQGGVLPTDVWLEVYVSPLGGWGSGPVSTGVYYRKYVDTTAPSAPGTAVGDWTELREAIRLLDIYDSAAPYESSEFYVGFPFDGILPLYTNGGVLGHDPVPCPAAVASSRDRLWVLDAEDRQKVWYSAPISPLNAPAFSALFFETVPTSAGEVVALGAIDDLVVFFGSEQIWALEAVDGPDTTGSGGFPPIRRLSTERGCLTAASVVTTDVGLMFQAQDGFWSIDGAGNMTPIGRPVRGALEGRTIKGAQALSAKQQVLWLLDDDTALVLSVESGAWAIHDYSPEDADFTAVGRLGDALVLGVGDGLVWRATDALPVEDGEPVDWSFTTGWIKLAGLQGFQRVKKLGILGRLQTGDTVTPDSDTHASLLGTLTLTVAYDYKDSDSDSYTLILTEGSGETLDPFYWRCPLARQKCKAVKITLAYVAPESVGEPTPPFTVEAYPLHAEIASLAMKVGVKGGLGKSGLGAGGTVL